MTRKPASLPGGDPAIVSSPERSNSSAIAYSPPGSWRAAMQPDATCAACRQTECAHPDAIYQGAVPLVAAMTSRGNQGSELERSIEE